MTANIYLDLPECFVVFNDDDSLPFEPVGADDLTFVTVADRARASMAWSADCRYYFVVEPNGIYLLHIDGAGVFCRRRSATFIKMFLDAPKPKRRRRAA